MHNFEFLRTVNIGQYLPLDSALHRLDSRARILAYFFILAAATFASHWLGLVAALGIVLAGLWIGRIPLKFALRALVAPLPFLAILAVLQIFFAAGAQNSTPLAQLGPLKIYGTGLVAAGMLLLRFVVLILGLGLASYTLSTSEMIHGMEALLSPLARIGIPVHDFVMVLQVTVRFIPFLAQAAERIAKAQASRGADWGTRKGNLMQRVRQFLPLLVPLFMTSLRRAEMMALAMDARGYGSQNQRTSMIVMDFRWRDALVIVLAVLMAVGILLIR